MKRATWWAVGGCVVALAVVVCVWPVPTWHRIHDDFWPFDRSFVGPNLVASVVQWAVIAGIAVVVYPPLRRWATAHWQHFHAKLDHNAVLLRKLVEVHPDIDNQILDDHPFPPTGHKPPKETP